MAYFVKNVLVVHHGEYNNLEVLSFVSRCRQFMWIRRRFDWVGLVVRALAFHQCGPGSISALGVKCGLSVLVLYSAMRGFPPGTPVFPSHQKPTFDLI